MPSAGFQADLAESWKVGVCRLVGRLKSYEASSGLRSMSVYGAFHHQLSPSWSINSSLGVKRLASDAADSPITQRKASVYGGVGLGYSF